MKKIIIAASIVLLAASCSKPQPVSVAPPSTPVASTTPLTDPTANWQTFTDNDPGLLYYDITNGFSFRYPRGWTIRQDENPRALLEIYDPESSSNLQNCLKETAPSDQLMDCGRQSGDYQIFLIADEYVNYNSLDSWLKTNYPNYNKVNIPGLDVFSYTDDNDNSLDFYYHINTPDQKSGLYFESFPSPDVSQAQADKDVFSQIVQTFGFLQTPLPAFSAQSLSVKYNNKQYGFIFSLPADWMGFSTYTKTWTGNPLPGSQYKTTISGPEIYIRNPNWTTQQPHEDIPIMVFTLDEWNEIQKETLAVSAAPIPPSKLGSNKIYVFALPARYDYDFSIGYQEVEKITQSNPLQGY